MKLWSPKMSFLAIFASSKTIAMQLPSVFKQYYKLFIWIFIIGYLCLAPADEFKKVHITIPYFDKLVHFMMFLVLAFLIGAKDELIETKHTRYLLFFFAALYGGIIELAQYYITNTRSADWVDWGADIVGVISGVGFIGMLPIWMRRLFA